MNGSEEKFTNLKVWQRAHLLVLEIYKITDRFPQKEKFILVPQIIRAAISIPANIVEGSKRKGTKDKLHFYSMAYGSLEELKYYLILIRDLGYIQQSQYTELISQCREISKMISALSRSIK